MGVDSQSENCWGNRLEENNPSLKRNRFGKIPRNYDQSATGRSVPRSATIDTRSMDFLSIKTSLICF